MPNLFSLLELQGLGEHTISL